MKTITKVVLGLVGLQLAAPYIWDFKPQPEQAAAVQSTPTCHGHDAGDGTWALNVPSWSDDEMREMNDLAKQARQLDPSVRDTGADMAALIDQMQCKGLSHEQAVQSVLRFAKRSGEIGRMTPEQRAAFAQKLFPN